MSSPRLSIPGPTQKKSPEMVGPFILGRTLGRGTTGKVKAAQHKDNGLEVAVKIVKKQYVKTHKNKIAREIAVMRLLDHPYVLKLYDVLETSQHIFIVMERVKGGELFDYILQKGRLPRQEALRLMAQIIQGMEFCHAHSICHRDLKPENLLLDENLNIKIADFGMAQLSPDGAALVTFCGSPHYGSPEVVSGTPYDGRVSDVWSMGVVLYALITGMLPFDNTNVGTLLKMVRRGVYHTPKFVPEDIADLISRMLTIDVTKRIKTYELKYHRCWLGPNGTNLYFPASPHPSPAVEMMKNHPLKSREELDEGILKDLEGLGWGNRDQLMEKVVEQRQDGQANLETIFYQLLASRNQDRVTENRTEPEYDESPDSPMYPASPRTPSSPGTPSRRVSVAASPVLRIEREKTPPPPPVDDGKKIPPPSEVVENGTHDHDDADKKEPRKGRPALSIKIQANKEESKHEYSTTPRFHRLKLISSQDEVNSPNSPNAPITPTAKRSWFKALFRRRPSVDIVGKQHQAHGASGMYSEKLPEELLKEVSKTLGNIGVQLKVGSTSDYELKCEAMCYLDAQFQIIVLDKNGVDIKYRGENLKDEDEPHPDDDAERAHPQRAGTASQAEMASHSRGSPASPKSPMKDLGKPQLIKFSVDIARESNDKAKPSLVSTVNFNHRLGDLLVYRGLYTEIIRHLHL